MARTGEILFCLRSITMPVLLGRILLRLGFREKRHKHRSTYWRTGGDHMDQRQDREGHHFWRGGKSGS